MNLNFSDWQQSKDDALKGKKKKKKKGPCTSLGAMEKNTGAKKKY